MEHEIDEYSLKKACVQRWVHRLIFTPLNTGIVSDAGQINKTRIGKTKWRDMNTASPFYRSHAGKKSHVTVDKHANQIFCCCPPQLTTLLLSEEARP